MIEQYFLKIIKSTNSITILILVGLCFGLSFYVWYKDLLLTKKDKTIQSKDTYIQNLTEKVFNSISTLEKLTTAVEVMVGRFKIIPVNKNLRDE